MKFSQKGATIVNNDYVFVGVCMPLKKMFAFGKSFLSRSAPFLAFEIVKIRIQNQIHMFMSFTSSIILRSYLIFVNFLKQAKFLENRIYTEKTRKLRKIHSKLPIFCVITAKYTVHCQFFGLNL